MAFARKHAFKIAVIALCAAMGVYLLMTMREDAPASFPMNNPAPEFELADALGGGKVKLSDSAGKVRLVYFYWSNCPDVCPVTTFILSKVQDELKAKGLFGSKAEIQSITFDPQRDTPEAIRKYADKFHADAAGWKFLRHSDESASAQLVKDFGLGLMKDGKGNFTHNDSIVLVDPQGSIRKYITGGMNTELTAEENAKAIVSDVTKLLAY
ncbi:SCO family protein [Paenibacillus beijingensis]|uniref:Thioredoxin domain-containing protein n=1 Tax=Paenibacillus beijingensis TaxID=1126833 RepID=A0A0D5NKU3_9BACL|nr:SCO family protein [Paenibacillus beijingensis]AJY75740.1 hypothetical protein VN24_15750 [Paenibacillus beijingensis]